MFIRTQELFSLALTSPQCEAAFKFNQLDDDGDVSEHLTFVQLKGKHPFDQLSAKKIDFITLSKVPAKVSSLSAEVNFYAGQDPILQIFW